MSRIWLASGERQLVRSDASCPLCNDETDIEAEGGPAGHRIVDVDRQKAAFVVMDLYCASYPTPPDAVTLDIDDTVDVVHGHQQSVWPD